METIGIEIKRYDELLKKETVYDIYRNKLLKDEFVSILEKTMFEIPERRDENDDDDF